VSRRGIGVVTYAATVALLVTLTPSAAHEAEAAGASATGRKPAAGAADAPAVLSGAGLRARLPAGGTVAYRLPPLPDGGVRVLGDWNHDGVETPGIFDAGQWQLWNQVQRPSSPAVTVSFGQAGDIPVTGDWNGDGITDLGVVHGSTWTLALGPVVDGSSPGVWHEVTFGGSGVPVTGDWNGDGIDGIGTVTGRAWLLANTVTRPGHAFTVWYGRPGDRPVVGDWDGDGRDGLGVVRGNTWFLSNRVVGATSARQVTLTAADGTPASWRVADVPGARTCPTARPGTKGHAGWVVPSALLGAEVRHLDLAGRRVRRSLEESERYLLGAQYHQRWRPTASRAYLDLLDKPVSDELAIRLPAMSALTVAVGLSTDALDPNAVGVSRKAGVRYVDQLVRSIACAHESVTPGGWGSGWETAHWAMLTGAAAWLQWRDLTPQTRRDVTRMVAAEADRLSALAVPYWGLPDGSIVTPGDTKAEENAWNSSLLAFAAAMMPASPRAPLWRAKSAELAVAAYATQSDDTSTTVVNGVPLASRLAGFNAYPDGTVENHGRIHPDYASAIQLLWGTADFDRLARQRVPEAMFHNAGLVYSAFSTVRYQAGDTSPAGGTYKDPGGTVYIPGHSSIYYPQGDDWGTARRAHFVSLDAHAEVYGRYLHVLPGTWPADQALSWHETGQRELVRSSGATDGRTYSVDPAVAEHQDTYPGREEYAAQNLATAWLALYVGRIGVPKLDRSTLAVPAATRQATKAPASTRLAP
jgi:hypothetical protein